MKNLAKIAAAARRLVAAGYPRERALLAVYATWALTPEEIKILETFV